MVEMFAKIEEMKEFFQERAVHNLFLERSGVNNIEQDIDILKFVIRLLVIAT